MAINQLGFEQAATLVAALHTQVTGMASITPTDTASFISMAQATLQAGYEPVLNAIGQVLGRTLIAVRPYSRKFKGLEMSSERWGGITRKINFGEKALDPYIPLDSVAIGDPTFSLTDGDSIDQFAVKKPEVLQTVYVGQNVYESSYTIFTKQLDTAFSSPAEFGAFMSGLMTHFSNEREQYLESLSRAILCNMIGAKKVLDDAGVDLQIIDLLSEYNTATGQSLTATTVKLPANYPAFTKWCYAYIQHVSELFTERTEMYQRPLTSYHIMRHTPKADQRLFMDADFLAHMTAEVLADTYHDNFLRYSEVEAVNFWQAAKDPNEVNVKPVYLNADCEYVNATDPVDVTGIVGVLMDADFLAHMTAEVLADVYHDNFLRYSEVEAVNFWQAAKDPNEVNVKPVYLNADCEYVNATDPVDVTGIVGVLMDRDAAGYNLADDDLVASPYNAKGQYYNLYNHVRIQLQNDLTEKAVVFCIGGSVNPSPTPEEKIFEGEITTVLEDEIASAEVSLDPEWAPGEDIPLSLSVHVGDTEYLLPKVEDAGDPDILSYGSYVDDMPDFTDYPIFVGFYLNKDGTAYDTMFVETETAETITITVEAVGEK